jgi:capsular polysaccharide biosynthesis protein
MRERGPIIMAASSEMLHRLLRQGALLAALAVLGLIGGAAYAALKTPTYTAQAYVAVLASPQADDATAVKFAQAYGRVATEPVVLAQTTATARGMAPADLRRQVRVTTSPDAPLVQLTGSAGDGKQAANLANEVAQALISFGNGRSNQTGVRLAIFAEASPPDDPSSPNPPLDLVIGATAGLLVGALAVMAGVGLRPIRRAVGKSGSAHGAAPDTISAPGPVRAPSTDGFAQTAVGGANGSRPAAPAARR